MKPTVDFGHEQVSPEEKTARVRGVFDSVASRYDLMNDLMSFGSHRLLKRILVDMSGVRPGDGVMDLAGGSGDLAAQFARVVGTDGRVVLADINPAMLEVGRNRLLNDGVAGVGLCQTRAEALPFADASFDCVSVAFGLRNFTDKSGALVDIRRVLAPGGVLLVLEFSKPANPMLDAAYRTFQSLWPVLGRVVTGESAPYRYLVESIERHPEQHALKLMIEDAGFERVEFHNLLGGIVAVHRGCRPR